MDELLDKMRLAVLEGDEDLAKKLAEASLEQNLDLTGVMDKGFLKGIMEAGQLYEDGEYFLPELICSADAMKVALD
ncbi:MAG: B12-binding domain-containing protein, partial [Eubacteriales bacterium]|nr:B12-binding domain-containing protein [Eubacteriales bacterium]